MAEERAQRRLATILAADAVGYSRLMEQDEAGTMALLRARRHTVLMPSVSQPSPWSRRYPSPAPSAGPAQSTLLCALRPQILGSPPSVCLARPTKGYGLAAHFASRIASKSRPQGILVSGTVKDLIVGAGIRFTSESIHPMKGAPGEWSLSGGLGLGGNRFRTSAMDMPIEHETRYDWRTRNNAARTHPSLGTDALIARPIHRFGKIVSAPRLGRLHH